ncbi:AAA family ATPase [Haloplasma contractile]|uniref:Stage V sporulation protein K n=1 Tax=Haloplasma contractile SSD-17B TaxID=1033810 RepID=U2EGK1_9MOLU|nr:AAA family ATPase [Haloplasma contractile]ERJ13741.1 Stage V sporulation protein K [Haloplasma contractile SSD-17B]
MDILYNEKFNEFKDRYFPNIIGLKNVLHELFSIYCMIQINGVKEGFKIKNKKQALNMVFYGNPGTGKTTIARKVAHLLKDLNYLSRGHLVEIDRSDLIGEYVGQTTIKTKKVLQEAKGGILFIDEAYSLYNNEFVDYGNEAIDIMLKFVEDNHEDIVVILAGYKEKITEMLDNNKGLSSRFPIQIEFKDYKVDDLYKIFIQLIEENEYLLDKKAEKSIYTLLKNKALENSNQLLSNGRYIRNLTEHIIRKHDMRVYLLNKLTLNDLKLITDEDIKVQI